MTEEEKALAESTPSQAPPPASLPPVNAEATAFVERFIGQHKVAIFSLEYCEFCWTIFRLFDAIGIPYERIDGERRPRIRTHLRRPLAGRESEDRCC